MNFGLQHKGEIYFGIFLYFVLYFGFSLFPNKKKKSLSKILVPEILLFAVCKLIESQSQLAR